MDTLPRLLDATQLPLAERMAAGLDGELYPLVDGHAPIDEPETPALRLAAALAGRPPRLIAELGTAAWVWGAAAAPIGRIELCVALRARAGAVATRSAGVREVVLRPGDVHMLDGRQVTAPLRTIIDLARSRDPFTPRDVDAVQRLAAIGGIALDTCLAALDARRNLPERRRAVERLSATLARSQPALTRYTS